MPAAKKKGFSDEAKAAGLKVNARGKVSSRPGPPARKQGKEQAEMMQQQQQQAAVSAAAAPAAEAPAAAPVASTSGRPSSSSSPQPAAAAAPAAAGGGLGGPSATPQVVINRMAKRVAVSALVPLAGGIASLSVFWYLKVRRDCALISAAPQLKQTDVRQQLKVAACCSAVPRPTTVCQLLTSVQNLTP